MIPNMLKIPQYLASHTEEDLVDLRKTIFSWANNAEGKTFYEFMLDNPQVQALFGRAMMTQEAAIPILGMYPFAPLNSLPADGKAAIVDVGGGRGQALVQILTEAPNLAGRVILQDRQQLLDAVPAETIPGIEKMGIDFWVSQPVKGSLLLLYPQLLLPWLIYHRGSHLLYSPHHAQLPGRRLRQDP